MDTAIQEGGMIVKTLIGPILKCINNCQVGNRADETQDMIDECWRIIDPIVTKIPEDRFAEIVVSVTSAQKELEGLHNKTRFPQSMKLRNLSQARLANHQAQKAIRLVRITSSLVERIDIENKRKEMETRQFEAAKLREEEEKKRLAEAEKARIDALVEKRLAEERERTPSETDHKGLTGRDKKRNANRSKKPRGSENVKSPTSDDRAAAHASAITEIQHGSERLGVDPKEMLAIILQVINLIEDKQLNLGSFKTLIRTCIDSEKASSTEKLAPDALENLVVIVINGLSALTESPSPQCAHGSDVNMVHRMPCNVSC